MNIEKLNLEPVFEFAGNESSILIHQSTAEICIGKDKYSGEAEVRLELLPNAHICIYGYFQGVPAPIAISANFGQTEISNFSIADHQIKGFRLSGGGDADSQEYNLKWCPSSEPINAVGNESTQMKKIIFHLFNFIDFLGNRRTSELCGSNKHVINHVDLICDEWKVELKSLPSTLDRIKILKAEGGYQLTHVGSIEKVDGTLFFGKYASECLVALQFFLSFAKGRWCRPICAVGFDKSCNRVWESWSSPKENWQATISWFDPHNISQLSALFPLFMNRWMNEDWHEALREVIYWYQSANESSRGIDAGIILTQAAIERLSYEYSVKYKRLLTTNGFKDLRASDKFRLLFSSLEIPIQVTKETPEIESQTKIFNWLDAPHALTEIRNTLVHPEHKKRGQLDSVYYEAWNLGLWYLEMGILAVCGYSGTYSNRLKQQLVGQVENVPWAVKKNN